MHVNAVGIWNVDPHDAKRIDVRACVLTIFVIGRLVRVPIDRRGRYFLAFPVEDANFLVGEIIRIRLHLWDQIFLDQRGRHGPKRIEIDLGRLGLHDWGLPVDLAHARDVMRVDDAALDGLHRGGGNIDHYKTRAEIARKGAQPDDVGLQLLQSRVGGHVEFAKSGLADSSGRAKPMARLEAFDRGFHERIEGGPHPGDGIEVARGDQALAQRLHSLRLRADLEIRPAGHGIPAAPRDNALIELNRGLGRGDRRRRKDRRRLAADRDALGCLVILPPLRLTGIGVVGPNGQGRQRRSRERHSGYASAYPEQIHARKLIRSHGNAKPR